MKNKEIWDLIPQRLQNAMLNKHAFQLAIDKGYIVLGSNGHLEWTLESNVHLAYFLGCIFCGDTRTDITSLDLSLWIKGMISFPGKELNELFGLTYLVVTRYKYQKIRKNHILQLIDNLLVI